MEKWNFVFNFMSMLASIGTAGTFCILLKERWDKRQELKRKKEIALRDLKKCNDDIDNLLKLLEDRKQFEMVKGNFTITKTQIDKLLSKLSIVAGYKIIDDEIHSALFQYINKINFIYMNTHNNMLKETQSENITNILREVKRYVNLAIKNLQD